MRSIKDMSYASATKVLLHFDKRFWEHTDRIYGGASHTDDLSRQIFYPSDNIDDPRHELDKEIEQADRQREQSREQERMEVDAEPLAPERKRSYSLDFDRAETLLQRQGQLIPKKKDLVRPGVLLAYCLGQDARRMGSLQHTDRVEITKRIVSRMHLSWDPSKTEEAVSGHESIFWDGDKFAAGAFAFLQPGEQSTLYEDAVTPISEGDYSYKLFLAGEHCSLTQGWIQGAIESSLKAVEHIVSI